MSIQAYLDTIEDKTGLTPREFIDIAKARGHGMALVHVIKKGPQIDGKHVGTTGSHSDESDLLWLDGKASKPA
ncbi:MAG: DUF4287 domain-containing protein [Rhodococcus sp. (in: high G+C Gram-positive bacteria)]|nr:DUF4287 domain-containing protein [Rhodococcus sp. (in: high G+C Gram-positive bacteria)]